MVDFDVICEEIRFNGLEDTLLKYGCSLYELFNYCLCNEGGVESECESEDLGMKYIYKHCDGRYRIRKTVDGRLVSFGYYDELDDAVCVRDRLVELGWKKCLLDDVCREFGIDL